ncbi:uncharacterized protein LOC114929790 [Nylanderia fulva]|uniref:uncharacterized protein LOC114929790 n=1 Tax=Nylanderia fulva TaxID=613905 RepID=UPI0010FB3F18|nr:uncharacterized protein LOC114929790 [Nylanderia fulva]
MDNIYVMNYLINRQLKRKGGKMTAMFVDLKAAFDSVDREKVMKAMEERGIRKGLRKRVEEVMRETISDLEEKMKVKRGGVRLGEKRIYTLAYVDDMVLLVEEEKELRSMIERLEEYLDHKRLELNAKKMKVMKFRRRVEGGRKGNGDGKERKWRK